MRSIRNYLATFSTCLAASAITFSGQAWAIQYAPFLGTGQNLTPGSRDSKWIIVEAPSDFASVSSDTTPFESYVIDPQPGPYPVLSNGNTFNAISYNVVGNDQYFDGMMRNWIFRQSFNIAAAGSYTFDFNAFADNEVTYFVDGTIDKTDPLRPTITGGIPLGTTIAFGPESINQTVSLNAGERFLYAVFMDFGSNAYFGLDNPKAPASGLSDVPAPLPLFGAAAAFGASRRLKRRIRLARPVAPDTAG